MNTGHGSKPQTRRESLFAAEVYRMGDEPNEVNEVEALRAELRNEVRSLRTFIARSQGNQDLSKELAAIRAAIADMASEAPKKGDRTLTWLKNRGIEGSIANRLAALVKTSTGTSMQAKMADAIAELISFAPWADDFTGRRIVAAVGSSGVGKTTTVAKLAARARMNGKSVALVSCDGFRVGATDQLERYADLLGASFFVARTAGELTAVLEDSIADVVFVDTSGRPPTAQAPEAALAARRKNNAPVPVEVLLCMAASTRAADAARISSIFAPVSPTSVCITKLDETVSPAGLIYAPWSAKKPLSVLCDGPRVPEDITPATRESVNKALAGQENGS